MDATPASLVYDSYRRWLNEVLIYKPNAGPTSPAAVFSAKYHYTIARLYPSAWVMDRYSGANGSYPVTGRAYLEETFMGYATAADLNAMEDRILGATSGCAYIPTDDPDAAS